LALPEAIPTIAVRTPMATILLRASPILALALGTWVGLGEPRTLPHPGSGRAARARSATAAPSTLPPIEGFSAPVDASLLPDPTPWPQLNPTASVSRAWLLAEGPAFGAASGRRVVTFTFDDGPFPETTPVVLHVLAKHNVHATFFWIGRYLDGDNDRAVASRKTAELVREAGHLVGNHTHDHARLTALSRADALAQINDGSESIERAVGLRPCVFRPPFGQLDAYTEGIVRDENLTVVLWNIEVDDLHNDDADVMADSLETQIDFAGGGIVLLHDIRFTTADALDKVLTWLDKHHYDPAKPGVVGYDVVDFTDFMRATAGTPQPYASRKALEDARAAAWRKAHARAAAPRAAHGEEAETL
jgi:peptidoglycan/xylan/chitin deacetylase (PgdA/CDA1 family)